jgi:hypothetical protein
MSLVLAAHSIYWDLPVVLVVVSLVYSATRFERWDAILRDAACRATWYVLCLGGIALVLLGVAMDVWPMSARVATGVAGIVVEFLTMRLLK